MATVGQLLVEISGDVAHLRRDLGKATGLVSGFTKSVDRKFKSLGTGIAGYFTFRALLAGVRSAESALSELVDLANAQEKAERTLTTARGDAAKGLIEYAAALQKQTAFGDEAIIEAEALISMFVRDEEQVKKATKATLDLAAAKGMDLKGAADLVSKSLGSSTNALSRYGIEITGAVGSTARLESFLKGINEKFGGQAAAQIQDYGGRLAQVKNVFGDLKEELGFVITKNQFFVDVMGVAVEFLDRGITAIKGNRQWLMDLAKDGFIGVVKALGSTIEVMRFFHNGWLGIKWVAHAAIVAITSGLEAAFILLRALMAPLDLIFDGLVALGQIDVNPFDTWEKSLQDFAAAQVEGVGDVEKQIKETNAWYDAAGRKVDEFVHRIETLRATVSKPLTTGTGGDKGGAGELGKAAAVYAGYWERRGQVALEGIQKEQSYMKDYFGYVKAQSDFLAATVQALSFSAEIKAPKYDLAELRQAADALYALGDVEGYIRVMNEGLSEQGAILRSNQDYMGAYTDFSNVAFRSMSGYAADFVDVARMGFSGIGDEITNLAVDGKANFKDLADAIIGDMVRIAVQAAIVAPLMKAVFGLFGVPAGTGTPVIPTAKGNVFKNGNVVPFGTGGILTRPTLFPMAGGAIGLAGEKGWEGIFPLTRLPTGELGVKGTDGGGQKNVRVELVNRSSVPMRVSESSAKVNLQEMVITILMDGIDRNAYGIRERLGGR